jgi:hypothetical protein
MPSVPVISIYVYYYITGIQAAYHHPVAGFTLLIDQLMEIAEVRVLLGRYPFKEGKPDFIINVIIMHAVNIGMTN